MFNINFYFISQIENKKAVPDTSMRIFTCAISVLKSWTVSKISTGLVMFEVYGKFELNVS